jgi:hypothetical protein
VRYFCQFVEFTDSRIRWIPNPIRMNDMKATQAPSETQSRGNEVMKALRITDPIESRSRVPPTAKRSTPQGLVSSQALELNDVSYALSKYDAKMD